MNSEKNPALLTIDEYNFMWGLLALQDPDAEKLIKMSNPEAAASFFPDGYTHLEALRLGLKYHRYVEDNEHPNSSAAKKTQNPVIDMTEYSENLLNGLSDPRLSDEDLALSGALEMDDAIPRLYRRVTSSLPESKTFRQEYAKKLDTFADIIEENGLLITTNSEDLNRPLLFERIEKNLCAMVMTMGMAQRTFLMNALEIRAKKKKNLERFTKLDISPQKD